MYSSFEAGGTHPTGMFSCYKKANKQECIPVGGVPVAAVAISEGGVCILLGGVSLRGVSLWTEFLTHSCENITFPQLLLRTVKNGYPNLLPPANEVAGR